MAKRKISKPIIEEPVIKHRKIIPKEPVITPALPSEDRKRESTPPILSDPNNISGSVKKMIEEAKRIAKTPLPLERTPPSSTQMKDGEEKAVIATGKNLRIYRKEAGKLWYKEFTKVGGKIAEEDNYKKEISDRGLDGIKRFTGKLHDGAVFTGNVGGDGSGGLGSWKVDNTTMYTLSSGNPSSSPSEGIVLDGSNRLITLYDAFSVSSKPRLKIGRISTGPSVYGIVGYADDGSTVLFEISGSQNLLSGWTLNSDKISKGSTELNATTERLKFGSVMGFASGTGVLIGKDGSDYEFYAGNSAGDYVHWNGSTLTIVGAITATTITATSGTIGGWTIATTLLKSAGSGRRIELNQASSRISVFDATAEKVVMGYLDGLTKNDGSGTWGLNDYGFWAKAGYNLKIDGDMDYKSGDFLVNHDASIKIFDGSGLEIIRIGTNGIEKGLFIWDTSSPQNLLAKYHSGGIYIGDGGTNYFSYDGTNISWSGVNTSLTAAGAFTATNATITGTITATSGAIGGFTINATQIYNSTNIILDSNTKAISLNDATFGNAGIQLQYNAGSPRAYIGDGLTEYFNFDGTNISFSSANTTLDTAGKLVTTSAEIAGWSVDTTKIYKTNAYLSSSGYISFGSTPPTAYGNNVGAWLGYATAAKMSLYASSTNYLQWDGAKLLIKASNFELNSSGNITASGGTIGGWTIGATSLTSTNIGLHSGASAQILLGHATDYASAKIGLKNDGSGKIANGNFSWDTSGNITGSGTWINSATITGGIFQTASSGQRVVINGNDNTLRFHTDSVSDAILLSTSVESSTTLPSILMENSGRLRIADSGNYSTFTYSPVNHLRVTSADPNVNTFAITRTLTIGGINDGNDRYNIYSKASNTSVLGGPLVSVYGEATTSYSGSYNIYGIKGVASYTTADSQSRDIIGVYGSATTAQTGGAGRAFAGYFDSGDVKIINNAEVGGTITIGTSSVVTNGTIRWTGTDFEGRKGGAWVSLTTGSGSSTLAGLTDTTISSPADGELLVYDNGTFTWVNMSPASAGLSEVGHTHSYLPLSGGTLTGGLTGTTATFSGAVTINNALTVTSTGTLLGSPDTSGGIDLDYSGFGYIASSNWKYGVLLDPDNTSTGEFFGIYDNIPRASASSSTPFVKFNPAGASWITGGNVLIGTTTDSGYKLDVSGTGRFTGDVTLANRLLWSGSATRIFGGTIWMVINRGNVTTGNSAELYFGETADTGRTYFRGSGATSFESNVLIGTTTDSGYKLDVSGTGRFTGDVILSQSSYSGNLIPYGSGLQRDTFWVHDYSSGNIHGMVISCDNNGEAHIYAVDFANTSGSPTQPSNAGGWGWDMYYDGTGNDFFRLRIGDAGTWTERMKISRYGDFTFTSNSFTVNSGATFSGAIIGTATWSGSSSVTAALKLTAQKPTIYFSDSLQTAPAGEFILHDSDDRLTFYRRVAAGGSSWTRLMYLTGDGNIIMGENGNVLIGTTTDSGYKLDVSGSIRNTAWFYVGGGKGGYSGYGIEFPSTSNDYLRIYGIHDGSDTSDLYIHTGDNTNDGVYFRNTDWSAGQKDYAYMGRNYIYLNPDGNVVIGSTGSGSYKLDVSGTGRFTGSVTMSSTVYFDSDSKRKFKTQSYGLEFYTPGYYTGETWGTRIQKIDTGGGIPLRFRTQYSGTWYDSVDIDHGQSSSHPSLKTYYTTQLAVTSGNVSIGTTNPGAKLHIVTGTPSSWGISSSNSIVLDSGSGNSFLQIRQNADSGTYSGMLMSDNNCGGYVIFQTYVGSGSNDGTNGDNMYYGAYRDHVFGSGSGNFPTLKGEIMRLKYTGDLHVANDVIAYSSTISDVTIKRDITPITNALDVITHIDGIRYQYSHKDGWHYGIPAQQVQKYIPEIVHKRDLSFHTGHDGEYLTVRDKELIPWLIEGEKELNEKIVSLEQLVEQQSKEIERLRAMRGEA